MAFVTPPVVIRCFSPAPRLATPAWSQELGEVDSQLLLAQLCLLPKWRSFSRPQAALPGSPAGEECRVRGVARGGAGDRECGVSWDEV